MNDLAIRVDNLSKQYRIGAKQESYKTLREQITDGFKSLFSRNGHLSSVPGHQSPVTGRPSPVSAPNDSFWALKDISFEVKRGEVVGIIGRNGAGKSTLLRVLSRITEPTEGQAEVHGRVGSLLEVGTGFHPELTGRENIYLNGAILGMRRTEIERKFDEIVAFAEVDRFIDTPVKHYSSGMYLRLAFAVAAHLDPEILMVDEVLAVGDAAFQKKCMGKMSDVAQQGRTVLFVSHNMGAIASLCSRAISIDGGRLVCDETPQKAIGDYLKRFSRSSSIALSNRNDREGSQHLTFTELRILNTDHQSVDTIRAGEDVTFELFYHVNNTSIGYAQFQLNFSDSLGQIIFTCFTKTVDQTFPQVLPGSKVRCKVPSFPLAPGMYHLSVTCYEHKTVADRVYAALHFTVTDGNFFANGRSTPPDCGSFMVRHRWDLVGETDSNAFKT